MSIDELSSFGPLALGQIAPHFAAATESGESFNSPLPTGKFTVYCIQDSLSAVCIDEGCGPVSHFVKAKGGRLIVMSDRKGAAAFGVRPRREHNSKLETTLVVICDANQRIVGIYKGATTENVESLVRRSHL